MHRLLFSILLIASTLAWPVGQAAAQEVARVSDRLLHEVMPEADRFDPAEGSPPVRRAYRGDQLIGFAFMTSDVPPEVDGYSAPIITLVGVTRDGVLTGVSPTAYRESRRYEWGDFLSEPRFLEQFVGKSLTDRFSVGRDIDGISQVTISVRAMALGIRDAARRVALAYADPPEDASAALTEEEILGLSWFDMQRRGIAATGTLLQTGRNSIEISVVHVTGEPLVRYLMGSRAEAFAERVREAGGGDEVILYAARGERFVPTLSEGWSLEQGGRTIALPTDRVVKVGSTQGLLGPEASQVGALLLHAGEVDFTAPFTVVFDRGRPELGQLRLDYTSPASLVRMAEAERAEADATAAGATEAPPTAPAPTDAAVDADATAASTSGPDIAIPEASAPPDAVVSEEPAQTDLADTYFEEPVGGVAFPADSSRVASMVLVILLASLAFFTKKPPLRWVSLSATMLLLGWIDGGFLSISHVTGLVWIGFSAIRSDLSLLLLVGFTVATVLLWGRVFCGFLCPFGALQDFIDRLVPRRFKRELPRGTHRIAWKAKYLILALIVGSAIAGVETSLYQYFEPFGTVFFLSSSFLLWSIAAVILVASAVIPRFYCRYMCPLGALLALGSVVSLRRIPRVEQCNHCVVCEHKCPTGAITGPKVAFGECVRCNVCEVQLIERAGVCRHDMDEVRPRLVQLTRSPSRV